jgi:hypothetical protein
MFHPPPHRADSDRTIPMSYTPRTIAFICELLHPPVNPDPGPIQKLHNEMFQSGQPAYSSFSVTPKGAELSNPVPTPGAVSTASFLADRMVFREEFGSLTHEGFASRVTRIIETVCELRKIQVITAQQVVVRSLVNPKNFKDSRAFLKSGMFGFDEETDIFGREPQLYGINLAFPPSPENPQAFALRVESFNNDPRSLFVENRGTFGPTVLTRGVDAVAQNIEATYGFLVQRALRFIASFDARQEA